MQIPGNTRIHLAYRPASHKFGCGSVFLFFLFLASTEQAAGSKSGKPRSVPIARKAGAAAPNPAIRIIKEVYSKLYNARSIRIWAYGREAGTRNRSWEGQLEMARGNKLKLLLENFRPGVGKKKSERYRLLSDGKRLLRHEGSWMDQRSPKGRRQLGKTPSHLNQVYLELLSFGMLGFLRYPPSSEKALIERKGILNRIRNLRLDKDGNLEKLGALRLQYEIEENRPPALLKVTLLVDRKLKLPMRRVIRFQGGLGRKALIESFERITLDAPLENKAFALPSRELTFLKSKVRDVRVMTRASGQPIRKAIRVTPLNDKEPRGAQDWLFFVFLGLALGVFVIILLIKKRATSD